MMGEFTLFSLAVKNLKRKPLRTAILIVAIGLLVSTTVFALSFVRRVDSSIKTASERLGADILIVPTGSRGAAEDVLLENKIKSFYMDKGIIDRVKKVDGIGEVTYQTYLVTITGVCCDVPESVVVAFDQDTDFIIKPWLNKKIGRRLKKGEAIAGGESAFNIRLGLTEVDSVMFGNVFKMIGVLDRTGTGLDNAIFIDEKNIEDILKRGKSNIKPEQISVIFAKVKKGFDSSEVAAKIEDSIIEVDTVARKDIGKSLIGVLKDINQIFVITIALASLLSIFLTWAVFSAVVNERSMEIGIMRAIGAKESHIIKIFVIEVLILGMAGSLCGIGVGTYIALTLSKIFTIQRNVSGSLSVQEWTGIALAGIVTGTGICLVGALSPIFRIKRLEPFVAIKEA